MNRICAQIRGDPREEVARSILATLGTEGAICVYSDYERHLLRSLSELFPDLKNEFLNVIDRLWDLLSIIQSHYYHPSFQGSFSIKSVLPSLVPELAYDDLDIPNGALASVIYRKMVFEEADMVKRLELAEALHAYWARDTHGMLELRRVLLRKASGIDPIAGAVSPE